MQIVIDISKHIYEHAKEQSEDSNDEWNAMRAIANGTPLPKGHGRLIDADEIQFENTEFDTYGDYCIAFDAIDQADTIVEAYKAESEEV